MNRAELAEIMGTKKRHGCHSAKRESVGYYAPDRQYRTDGTFVTVMRLIPNTASRKRRSFELWDTNPDCAGCTTPKDHEFANQERSK